MDIDRLPFDSEKSIYLEMITRKMEDPETDESLIEMFDNLKMSDREIEIFKVARYAASCDDKELLHGVSSVINCILNKRGDQNDIEYWISNLLNTKAEECLITPDKIKEGALSICETEQDMRSVIFSVLVHTQWESRIFDILSSVLATILTDHKEEPETKKMLENIAKLSKLY